MDSEEADQSSGLPRVARSSALRSASEMKVTQLPLVSLRTPKGVVARRERRMTGSDIEPLLSTADVTFVVADLGRPLRWIPASERFRFWEAEARPHVATTEKMSLDDCPDGYGYFASEWHTEAAAAVIILLEKHH